MTLTYALNETDLTKCNKDFSNYLRQVKRYCASQGREFYYLAVPEFQDRGAVHYHMFMSEACGSFIVPRQDHPKELWDKVNQRYNVFWHYDFPYWNHGFTQGRDLTDKHAFDDRFNLALYMCGYLYKDLDRRLFGRTKILKSNNLEKPTYRYLESNEIYDYAVEYIKKKGYDINYYKTRIVHYEAQMTHEFESSSAMLNKTDHQFLSELFHTNELCSHS